MRDRTTVVIEVYRVCCPGCGIKIEKVPQLPSKAPFSKRFEEVQRETRIARIREAHAREQAERQGKDPEKAAPEPKAQCNFTDTGSRTMKGSEGLVQAYHTQVAVEPIFQLIVEQRVPQAGNDQQRMMPLLEAIEELSGQKPKDVPADSGYCLDNNLKYLAKKKTKGFVSTKKRKYGGGESHASEGVARVERMERKLETKVEAAGCESDRLVLTRLVLSPARLRATPPPFTLRYFPP
jgi:hypothetical protein